MAKPDPPKPNAVQRRLKRDAEIRAMHAAGFTCARIAARFKLTDTRVWQIVTGYRSKRPQPMGDSDA